MESYETVDFTHEIAKIREKIKLIIDVKNVIQNLSKIKQSVEMLESIYNRVNEFADPKHNGKCFFYPYKFRVHDIDRVWHEVDVRS